MMQAGNCDGYLISNEEWALFKRFILSGRTANARIPTNHRPVPGWAANGRFSEMCCEISRVMNGGYGPKVTAKQKKRPAGLFLFSGG
jgi:hypothetical protein